MNSLRAKGINAFIAVLTGKLANHGVGFIISIILARLLTPEEFGLVAMINVLLAMATILMEVGLGEALIQRKRLLPIHYSSVFYFNVFAGCLLSIITYLSAEAIADFYERTELILLTQAMSISFFLSSLVIVQNSRLAKELNFKKIAIFKLISSLLSGLVGVVLALNNYGVWSLVVQILLGILIYVIIIWTQVKWIPQFRFSLKALKNLWGYGFRMFLSAVLNKVFVKIDVLIIGKIFHASALGFYQRARSFEQMVIQYSSGSMMEVLFPLFCQIQTDTGRLKNLVLKALNALSLVVFYLLGVLYLCADNIIVVLLTEKWLVSAVYFKILLLGGYAYPFSSLLINIISSRGNSKDFLKLAAIRKIMVAVNLIIGFNFGISGYLYGFALVRAISLVLNIIYAGKELKTPFIWFVKPMVPFVFLSVFLVIGITGVQEYIEQGSYFIDLIINGSLYTALFLGITYFLKLPGIKDILTLVPWNRNK